MNNSSKTKKAELYWSSTDGSPSKKVLRKLKSRGVSKTALRSKNVRFNRNEIVYLIRDSITQKPTAVQVAVVSETGLDRRNIGNVKNGLFFTSTNPKTKHINLAEGPEDALALDGLALMGENCATLGVSGMRSFVPPDDTKSINIYPDMDDAGMHAALELAERLRSEGFKANIIALPVGKDPNEYVLAKINDPNTPNLPKRNTEKNIEFPAYEFTTKDCISLPESYSFSDLMNSESKPIPWLLKNRIPYGLTLLAGPPKIGKSWLCLLLAIHCARGGKVLGKKMMKTGDVLLLSLEDTNRRLQRRFKKLGYLEESQGVGNITVYSASSKQRFPDLDKGGYTIIEKWCDHHPNAKMIIIDVFERVRPSIKGRSTEYKAVYTALEDLHRLANDRGLVVILVTHTRKSNGMASDPFETVMGTTGLVGVADTTLVFQQAPNGSISLHGKGRDLEGFERAVKLFHGTWRDIGEPKIASLSSTNKKVFLEVKSASPDTIGPKAISKNSNVALPSVQKSLTFLCRKSLIRRKEQGKYVVQKREK